jgi:hypothetical protein
MLVGFEKILSRYSYTNLALRSLPTNVKTLSRDAVHLLRIVARPDWLGSPRDIPVADCFSAISLVDGAVVIRSDLQPGRYAQQLVVLKL